MACSADTGSPSDENDEVLGRSQAPLSLKARVEGVKPKGPAFGPGVFPDRIVVKFVEGSRIRLRGGTLAADAALSAKESARLSRRGLARSGLGRSVSAIGQVLAADPAISVLRHFERPEADLEAEQNNGEAASGEELADLNLYYTVNVPSGKAQAVLDALNASDIVETAYPAPIPVGAAADLPPTTSSYTANQGYLSPAPNGIDARYAWTQAGGTGTGVKIVDIEQNWNYTHEDLPSTFTQLRFGDSSQATKDHGTAVVGEMVAANNAYGVTGACYGATYGTAGVYDSASNYSVAAAITAASGAIAAGDIILIEQHSQGPASGLTCTCNCTQFEYVAMENWQAEYDAIRTATTNGRIVVEAAGNGSMNLDSAIYGNRFNRATRDSGAILVGAGIANTREPECYTNSGARVDVQGWGDSVMTLGYGTIQVNGADQNQWYTTGFSGTSSASPIVVAAAADIQGRRKSLGQAVLTSTQMRTTLTTFSTPQPTPVTRNIGPLPNLRAALSPMQPLATGSIAAARQSANVTTTISVGGDGAVYRRWVGSNGVWQLAVMTAPSFAPPGGGVALALRTASELDAFVVGNDGKLYVMKETNDGAWSAPAAITAAGYAPPGAQIAAGKGTATRLDVLTVATNGALKVVSNSGASWSSPSSLTAANYLPPGANLAAGIRWDELTVVFVDNTGTVQGVNYDGSWTAPWSISDPSFGPPGAGVSIADIGDITNVQAIGWDGAIDDFVDFTFFWDGPSALTPTYTFPPGGGVTAVQYGGTQRVEIIGANNDGVLQVLTSTGLGVWATSSLTAANAAVPGSRTAAATQGTSQLDLFGVVQTGMARTVTTNGTSWSALTLMP